MEGISQSNIGVDADDLESPYVNAPSIITNAVVHWDYANNQMCHS